jgi:hypothetical protein
MKHYEVIKYVDGKPINTNNKYLVINVDAPYAEQVFNLLKEFEKSKGTWGNAPNNFDDFVEGIT